MRIVLLLVLCVLTMMPPSFAADHVVFVSAFKSGADGAIHAFRFDSATGTLTALHQTTDVQHPFFMAISVDARFLYAIDTETFSGPNDEFVAAYEIQGRTGQLKRLNKQSSRGTASCYLDVDATGKTVLVANYTTGSVAAFPVQQDGSLKEAASFVQHTGSSTNPDRQTGPKAHSIEVSPDNRFVLAADLGIDKVLVYQLDAANAKLTAHSTQPFVTVPPGSGPRHLTFHPNGNRVYVINELANTIAFFDYATDSGTLTRQQIISTLPESFDGVSHTADVKITPDGRFLYGTNRGHDSIAAYRIADDGRLNLIAIEPSLGKGPQNLLVTPDGRWLLCANMPGNNVVVFAIDPNSGKLTATGNPVPVMMASCIRLLPTTP
ncbi:MAG: lactonase family protein [Planctomycetaceae bacterium]